MTRLPRIALACLALAFGGAFVAACGSDDNKDSSAGTSTPATVPADTATTSTKTTGGTAAPASTPVEVTMQGNQNTPADITVKVGQKIDWNNKDGYAHNVTSTGGEKIESGNFTDKFEFAPKKAGKITYVCTIHSGQGGTITVK